MKQLYTPAPGNPSPCTGITRRWRMTVTGCGSRYDRITDRAYLRECSRQFENVMITGESPVLRTAHDEFIAGLESMTGMEVTEVPAPEGRGTIIAGTFSSSPLLGFTALRCSARHNRRGGIYNPEYQAGEKKYHSGCLRR